MQSMVQRVWGQLTSLGIENDVVIATSKSQVDMINSQLGNDVSIIIEPERRDTFPQSLLLLHIYILKSTLIWMRL